MGSAGTLLLLLAALLAPQQARADASVADKLIKHTDYKVRLQAAIFLGRVKEAKTLGALVLCLGRDDHYLVRAFCANALGNLGWPRRCRPPVPARRQAPLREGPRAEGRGAHPGAPPRAGAARPGRQRLRGAVQAEGHRVPPRDAGLPEAARVSSQALGYAQQMLRVRLNEVPAFEIARERLKAPIPWLQNRRLKAATVHATLVRLERRTLPAERQVFVGLNAVVSRYPTGGVVFMATTEAQTRQPATTGAGAPKDLARVFEYLEREAMEGAVERLAQRISQSTFN